MEVHTHAHTARKKWTHYLWEFLMLFLAVFCGFLAEYQLEHKIEKERGKQYLRSFYEDLKADTANLGYVARRYDQNNMTRAQQQHCFAMVMTHAPGADSCLNDLFKKSFGFSDLVTEDRTLQQLKNAGGLRLLPQSDADSILRYDRMIRNYQRWETTGLQECQYRIRAQINTLMDYRYIAEGKKGSAAPLLFRNDPEKINLFFVTLDEYAYTCHNMNETVKEIREQAVSLLAYFHNKYNFD